MNEPTQEPSQRKARYSVFEPRPLRGLTLPGPAIHFLKVSATHFQQAFPYLRFAWPYLLGAAPGHPIAALPSGLCRLAARAQSELNPYSRYLTVAIFMPPNSSNGTKRFGKRQSDVLCLAWGERRIEAAACQFDFQCCCGGLALNGASLVSLRRGAFAEHCLSENR